MFNLFCNLIKALSVAYIWNLFVSKTFTKVYCLDIRDMKVLDTEK